ncbi:SDR family oxidoreductase [Alicyclobacillus tolerans]|uniref:SDR family NAD(P)-dependent oxidoreductase n=1 Tax=Alicyclobacillus tolerans TaxID=90970 RepID=UPI001F377553|nr:SDR family oxidoreductase [Alicyclobacillus tolerans]MCF8568473.1 SDR family oxidoreductase [Alicyclobacillus tolerans]
MLDGKVILVTGGSTGIGAGICRYTAQQGAEVAINYKETNTEDALNVKSECQRYTQGSEMFEADLSERSRVLDLADRVWNHYGKIDVFVHNAAVCPFNSFVNITPEEWEQTLNVNLNAGFYLSQALVKKMIESNVKGRIIFITSVLAEVAAPTQVHYAATKAALKMLTKGMARELGTYGITVNAVGPAAIETELSKHDWEQPGARERIPWLVPVGHLGEPRDVAAAVTFLASDQASFITGHSLYVDGGLLTSKK